VATSDIPECVVPYCKARLTQGTAIAGCSIRRKRIGVDDENSAVTLGDIADKMALLEIAYFLCERR
jgi:hypothetical protein